MNRLADVFKAAAEAARPGPDWRAVRDRLRAGEMAPSDLRKVLAEDRSDL
jgi:hypothetical protein